MSFRDCLEEITKAVGRKLSDDELDDLLTELQKRIRERQKARASDAFDDAVMDAADSMAEDLAHAAIVEKRNAAINLRRRLEILDFVRTSFANDYALGLEAALVGVNRPEKGARMSAAAAQNMLKDSYLGGFIADVERLGHWRLLVRGEMDREISRALWARDMGEGVPKGIPREAAEIAEVIAKYQELVRINANRAGAWIKKMPGYIVRQSHDMNKIRDAGFDRWYDEILPRLDADRTFGLSDPREFLENVYEGLASGIHLKTGDITGFKGPRNIAKRLSAERVLHFKSADDWFDYNQRFGTGSLREALLRGFEVNAHATGLMRHFGPNPEATFDRVTKELLLDIKDPDKKQKLESRIHGKLSHQLSELDGSARVSVDKLGAAIGSNFRIIQRTAKLGASLASQFGDIPLYGMEMRYQGVNLFEGIAESMGHIGKGRGSAQKRELLGMLGVVSDMMSGEVQARFSIADDDLPGFMTRLQQKFFKWNGMTWWTDSQRRGATMAMAWRLAHNKGKSFNKLSDELRRVLGLYGIDEPEWDVIRAAYTRQADGRNYVVPEAIKDVADEMFEPILGGRRATPNRIAEAKREVADKLMTYYNDRAKYATIVPDQRVRAAMTRGTQPGTIEGELIRFLGELKAFSISVIQKQIGREVYGRGARTLGDAMRNGNGEMLGLAELIVSTMAFGYVALSAKSMLKGRTPRDPREYKTWVAAMAQGGGLGIYGDFLFGEMRTRFGRGLLTTAAGPTLGAANDIADLWGRVRNGEDAAAAAFRFALGNTPFINLFYTKLALDYFILWRLQEWLNPGSMRRYEQAVERNNAQTFIVRPSQAVR